MSLRPRPTDTPASDIAQEAPAVKKRRKKPTIRELINLAGEAEFRVVDRAYVAGSPVRGHYDDANEIITLSLAEHRKWSGADDLVGTAIHELLHLHNPDHTEVQVRRWEMEFFKSRAVREAVLLKLVNVILFGQ